MWRTVAMNTSAVRGGIAGMFARGAMRGTTSSGAARLAAVRWASTSASDGGGLKRSVVSDKIKERARQKAAITIRPAAIERLRALISDAKEPRLIRVSVRNKGCAGMSYHFDYIKPEDKGRFDEVVKQDGIEVLIDSRALFSIIGSEMDWKEDLLSARFVFDNPNVKDACGCGESFLV